MIEDLAKVLYDRLSSPLVPYLGEIVVEVGGQPREQDEEAVVLAKVADDAGPESGRGTIYFSVTFDMVTW